MKPAIDPKFKALVPPHSETELRELERAIIAWGAARDPIVLWNGFILDGHNRFEICDRNGLPFSIEDASGRLADRAAAIRWICDNQEARRNLSPVQRVRMRRSEAEELAAEAAKRQLSGLKVGGEKRNDSTVSPVDQNSDQRGNTRDRTLQIIAERAGTSHDTVHRINHIDAEAPDPIKRALDTGALSVNAAYEATRALAKLPEPEREAAAKRIVEAEDGKHVRKATAVSGAEDYDGDEWYTPPDVIQLVRDVLGTIDLDPASNEHAQTTVQAGQYFTREINALDKEWKGNVFCNPPYSTKLIQQFTDKLLEEYNAGRCAQAIYLVNNCTDAGWFHAMLAYPVCLTKGRIGFLNRDGQKFATRQGQAIFYLGKRTKLFAKTFSALGAVVAKL